MSAASYLNERRYPVRQVAVATLAAALALLAGISGVVYRSDVAPLVFGSAICMVTVIVFLSQKPVWALYATLAVVFLPVGILPAVWQSNLNRSMTVFAFGVWLLATIAFHRRVAITNIAWWMFAFIVWSLATLIWARDLAAARVGIQTYVLRLMLFLVLIPNLVRTRKQLDGLMRTLAVCGWILIVATAAAIASTGYSPGDRLHVFDMNENATGVLALIAMVGILWPVTQSRDRSLTEKKTAAILYVGIALVVTAATGSRGSALSFVLTLAAFWLWQPTRGWAMIGLILVVAAIALVPSAFATLSERFTVERGDTLLGNREVLWRSAWILVLDHSWLGVGIGNAPHIMASYARAARGVGQYDAVSIHNPVLTIWAETGVIGILLYLGVLVSAMWTFVRRWLSDRRAGQTWVTPYYALIAAVTLGYLASWIKGGGIESDRTYFLLLALLVLPSHLSDEGTSDAGSASDATVATPDIAEGYTL